MFDIEAIFSSLFPSGDIYLVALISDGAFEDKRIIVGEKKADIYYKSITFRSFKDPSDPTNEKAMYKCMFDKQKMIDDIQKCIGVILPEFEVGQYMTMRLLLENAYKNYVIIEIEIKKRQINRL